MLGRLGEECSRECEQQGKKCEPHLCHRWNLPVSGCRAFYVVGRRRTTGARRLLRSTSSFANQFFGAGDNVVDGEVRGVEDNRVFGWNQGRLRTRRVAVVALQQLGGDRGGLLRG